MIDSEFRTAAMMQNIAAPYMYAVVIANKTIARRYFHFDLRSCTLITA